MEGGKMLAIVPKVKIDAVYCNPETWELERTPVLAIVIREKSKAGRDYLAADALVFGADILTFEKHPHDNFLGFQEKDVPFDWSEQIKDYRKEQEK